jgi:hypothetical protein
MIDLLLDKGAAVITDRAIQLVTVDFEKLSLTDYVRVGDLGLVLK